MTLAWQAPAGQRAGEPAQDFSPPKAIKCFQRYSHTQRADLLASHRLGYRQKQRVGEVYWIHPAVPGIAFKTRAAANRAALSRATGSQP